MSKDKKTVENLKYAVFKEWSDEPPAGESESLYPARGEAFEDLMEPVKQTFEDMSHALNKKETAKFTAIFNKVKPEKKSILAYSWDAGDSGCGCVFLAEGKEIAKAAADFYRAYLQDTVDERYEEDRCYDDDDDEDEEDDGDEEEEYGNTENVRIMEEAEANPENYDAVIALLDMVDESIEIYNDVMLG